jgi:hypothetical protein
MFSSKSLRFVVAIAAAFQSMPSTAAGSTIPPALEAVDLGDANNYAILTKAGITNVPDSVITGNIGVSPITGEAMTGFDFYTCEDGPGSTGSAQLTGIATASNWGDADELSLAVGAMETAYTDAAGRTNDDAARIDPTLGADCGGATTPLTTGVYTFGTTVSIAEDIYFNGSDTEIFIIQIASYLTLAEGVVVHLEGGAKSENIFWQVAGYVTVGANAQMEGIILGKTAVTFTTGSTLNGRILAQTAASLDMATITEPPSAGAGRRSLLRKGL